MKKRRPGTLESVKLALEILRRIPRGRYVTAPQLREQLAGTVYERDLRTVQRVLTELSQQFEIECDSRDRPYGYKWKERAVGFAVPGLTRQESLLLALTQEHLRNLLPAGLMKSMAPFFAQARATLMNSKAPVNERQWLKKVRVVSQTQPLLPPPIDSKIFAAVSTALFEDRWLDITYVNAVGKKTSSSVMPLGIVQQGERLFLVCRFDGYDNERNLALNRLRKADLTNRSFVRPPEFDLARYDAEGRFGYGDGRRIRLRISIDKRAGQHLLESRLSEDQVVAEAGDRYEVTATVVQSELLRWWLMHFGGDVWILEPPELYHELRSLHQFAVSQQ